MYSSWRSAQPAASSVGIDWFWPSGSSVTRYVERLDLLGARVLDHPLRLRKMEQHLRHVETLLSSAGLDDLIERSLDSFPFCGLSNEACGDRDRIASSVVEAKHDVLIVGAGCAGMRDAIEAHDAGADVALLSKIHPVRSHSGAAEGGINAALGNASEDNPEIHAYDTVKGSDYLGDQDAIEILCDEAPDDVYQLENWGAVFSRT